MWLRTSRVLFAHITRRLESSIASSENALVSDPLHAAKLAAAYALPPGKEQNLELFRLHNSSLPHKEQMVVAKVIEIDKKRVLLDIGTRTAKLAKADISPEDLLGTTIEARAGEAWRGSNEVHVGDVIKVFLEQKETPEGDALVISSQAAVRRRLQAVWHELDFRRRNNLPVKGRVLNQLRNGYAVGIAGLVAFLPSTQCRPTVANKIGELQELKVLQMTASSRNIIVRDAGMRSGEDRRSQHRGEGRRRSRQQDSRRRVEKEAAEVLRDVQGAGSAT